MSYSLAALFGLVQGLTEFLPVSSSGHLAILSMLSLSADGAVFTLLLHLATFAAVCVAFKDDIFKLIRELFCYIPDRIRHRESPNPDTRRMLEMAVISLLPLIIVLPIKDTVEAAFSSPIAIGVALAVTSVLLILADRFGNGDKTAGGITVRDALVIGIFQLFAVLPGLSRSGATITAALLCGLSRDTAVKYSFIISLPTILAAVLLDLPDIISTVSGEALLPMLLGFAVAAVSGYFAIGLVKLISGKRKFWIFSVYTAALSAGLIISQIVA
ncbi:MAG: undecaprenyl-diphosphate phosphatase [Clostridia bacterium]|nr:undecaprenyl-diphosphate phosphatase [Clostridia bacterium]